MQDTLQIIQEKRMIREEGISEDRRHELLGNCYLTFPAGCAGMA